MVLSEESENLLKKLKKRFRWEERFTFMVVPHSKKSVLRMHFSKLIIVSLVACLCIGLLTGAFMFWRYQQMEKNMVELDHLRSLTEDQKDQIESLAKETEEIQEYLQELQTLDEQIRAILKLEKAKSPTSSLGDMDISSVAARLALSDGRAVTRGDSGSDISLLTLEVENIKDELGDWQNNLEMLKDKAEDHAAFLAAKPKGWPTSGRITSGFGYRKSPTGRGTEFHSGLDVANAYGSAIRATGSGKVVFAGWRSGYGWTVIIDHQYGYQTLYAHCSKLQVSAGDRVTRGNTIANIGTSGRSTGPHVHYEVLYRSEHQNPSNYLR